MIIKWDKGEILYKDDPDFPDGMVDRRWEAGTVEFCKHWFHVTDGGLDSLIRYDQITRVDFFGHVVVGWHAKESGGLWTPKAREIYDELMARARALFLAGEGAGQLTGEVS